MKTYSQPADNSAIPHNSSYTSALSRQFLQACRHLQRIRRLVRTARYTHNS